MTDGTGDEMEVDLLSLWDGQNAQTPLIAEMHMRFPDFEPPFSLGGTADKDFFLLTDLEKEIQFAADARFGRGTVKFECVRVVRGSLVILATLTAVGGAVYQFFKDYPKLREGVLAFVSDLKAMKKELRRIVKRRLKPSSPGAGTTSSHKRRGGAR